MNEVLKSIYNLQNLLYEFNKLKWFNVLKKRKLSKKIDKVEEEIMNYDLPDLIEATSNYVECYNKSCRNNITNHLIKEFYINRKFHYTEAYTCIKIENGIVYYNHRLKRFDVYDNNFNYSVYKNTKLSIYIQGKWEPVKHEVSTILYGIIGDVLRLSIE